MDFKKPIIFAFVINLIILLLQRSGFDPIYDEIFTGGLVGNPARFGIYSALVIPFMPLIFIILSAILLLVTKQITIFIPIFLYLMFKIKSLKKRIWIIAIFSLLAVLLQQYIINEFSIRIKNIWYPILKQFFDMPLIGFGLGKNPIVNSNIGVYMNSYIQLIVGLGILGLVWFGYVFNEIHKYIKFDFNIFPLLSLIFIMLIEYPIEIPRFWFIIMTIFVVTLIKGAKNEALG